MVLVLGLLLLQMMRMKMACLLLIQLHGLYGHNKAAGATRSTSRAALLLVLLLVRGRLRAAVRVVVGAESAGASRPAALLVVVLLLARGRLRAVRGD